MYFSQFFEVSNKRATWFDPILDHDTKLFVDPFLVFSSNDEFFDGAHDELINFFDVAFKLAAESGGNTRHPAYPKLLNMLHFPEPSEFCLGYTTESTYGSGTGSAASKMITSAILQSISLGIQEFSHFEEIGLLHEGIGCDGISDITLNILKRRFIGYTQKVCTNHGIPVRPMNVKNTSFDYRFNRWVSSTEKLPVNPFYDIPIILTPKSFLKQLPTIYYDSFRDFLWDAKNEEMRADFNYELKSGVGKKAIIEIAKKNRFWVREYLESVEGSVKPTSYDLELDDAGVYQWERNAEIFTSKYPLSLNAYNLESFKSCIESTINQYKLFVEDNAGYRLLWNTKTKPKNEEAAQLLFLGVAKGYFIANNIDISRETNIGRGPVDFKFSTGYANRALMEVKKANNTKFWRGLERQLPKYMEAENISIGYYLVIVFGDKDFEKIGDIRKYVQFVSEETGMDLSVIVVDATLDKPSASKL